MNDKYRWHDLLANPEELPDDEHRLVIVCLHFCGKTAYTICNYSRTEGFLDGVNHIVPKIVLAWRYLDPFGGDES